eukprot:2336165-Rhodomonas_salina.2
MERMISTIEELARNPLKPLTPHAHISGAGDNETRLVEHALRDVSGTFCNRKVTAISRNADQVWVVASARVRGGWSQDHHRLNPRL